MASNISKETYFLGTLILGVISGLLFLVSEFAWWQELQNGDVYYVWVGGEYSGLISALLLIGISGLFFYQAYVSILALRRRKHNPTDHPSGLQGPTVKQIKLAFSAATLCFVLTLAGWLIFEIIMAAWDFWDWDLSTSFYAGIVGGGLNAFLFRQLTKL